MKVKIEGVRGYDKDLQSKAILASSENVELELYKKRKKSISEVNDLGARISELERKLDQLLNYLDKERTLRK